MSPEVAMSLPLAVTIFALFIVVALTGGLVVNTITLALPKIVDERVSNLSLATVGWLTRRSCCAARSLSSRSAGWPSGSGRTSSSSWLR